MRLGESEPPALQVERPLGSSDLLFTCDHASQRIPAALDSLGLDETQRASHIAWDIGAAVVARRLSQLLDATLVMQNYSRLVIDCNRPPRSPTSIPMLSEDTVIDANAALAEPEVDARIHAIFRPYHDGITRLLDERASAGRRTLLVAMHSFTPVYQRVARPWHVGLMYRHDRRLGTALLQLLRAESDLQVGDNEPYAIEDETDYSLIVHGEARGLPHVGIEIRQDLIADATRQHAWAARLAPLLMGAASAVAND